MGLILDLAVVALALAVIASLALLAWTFAVTAVRATRLSRERIAAARASVGHAEARLRTATERASATLAQLAHRTSAGEPTDR